MGERDPRAARRCETKADQSEGLLADLRGMALGRSPAFLGQFQYRMWTFRDGDDKPPLAASVWSEARRIWYAEAPEVRFNCLFVQRYAPGQGVSVHRDPSNNLDGTLIALYGAFGTTHLHVLSGPGGGTYEQHPGDVFYLPCTDTKTNTRGPAHAMGWPTPHPVGATDRFAVILNRIVR